jgi:hypothetical protein
MDKIAGAVLVSLFSVFFAPSAIADNSPPVVSAGYFGAGVGSTKVDVDTNGTADRVDETGKYIKIFGGIKINPEIYPNLNIEFGYIDFGEYSAHFPTFDETDTATASAVTVCMVGNGDLNKDLNIWFKLGLHFWKAEYEVEGDFNGPVSGSGDGTGNSTFVGAGFDYKLNQKTILRLEFEKYKDVAKEVTVGIENFGSFDSAGSDVDLLGLAIIFAFE